MNATARWLGLFCIAVVTIGCLAGSVSATEGAADGQFIVELDTNGDADVVFTDEFDLTDDEQRAVFEDAEEDEELRAAAASQLQEGMQSIADETNEEIDREMRIGDVTVETGINNETGVVAYRFRWENLAVVEDDQLVLREPFSTFATVDRELIVLAPEGGEIVSASPPPERQGEDVVSWPGLTEFGDEFEVVTTIPETASDDGTPETEDEQALESEFAAGSQAYGGAPIALGVSVLLLATLFIGRKQ